MELKGFLGKVLGDTRRASDPWGFGFEAEILRSNHPDWQKVETERLADSPTAEKSREAIADHSLSELAPAGFRSGRKLTKGESFAKLRRKFAEKSDIETPIETVRHQKAGIVAVLLKGITFQGGHAFTRGAVSLDLATAEGRAGLLDHRTWIVPGLGEQAIPVLEADPATGEPKLDSEGDPIESRHGGDNVGDALARWLLAAADDLALYEVSQVETAQGESAPISDGFTGTGMLDPSASAEP